MATKTNPRDRRGPGFDVVCTIGRVSLDGGPDDDMPHVAAFRLIAEHDAPGRFTFPMSDGRECAVTVEHAEMGGSA